MSHRPPKAARIIALLILAIVPALLVWTLRKPQQPAPEQGVTEQPAPEQRVTAQDDAQLVRQLLAENLDTRRFSFPVIVEAVSGKQIIPLDLKRASHQRVTQAIETAMQESTLELSREDSPIRELRRINEGSKFFEDALREKLNATDGLRCEVPTNRDGEHQRSGYPDLKVIDTASGDVFYLDPKLVENTSWKSSFRSFYFAPKNKTLKINDDAVHLLVGIGHDGQTRAWTFTDWKIIDLSTLSVRLKAEFQASNADLYPKEEISKSPANHPPTEGH